MEGGPAEEAGPPASVREPDGRQQGRGLQRRHRAQGAVCRDAGTEEREERRGAPDGQDGVMKDGDGDPGPVC